MSARRLLAFAAIGLLSAAGIALGAPLADDELNGEAFGAVLADFFDSLAGEAAGPGKPAGGRRLTQFDGFDNFLRDFDLSLSLSEFLDGLLRNPGLDFAAGPLTQERVEEVIREKYDEYCGDAIKQDGREARKNCTGPSLTLELLPA
eukprot:evm.model.scf_404.5 EVM.evm.TU.scf_404.5   scf_404:72476-72915(-)